MLIEDQSYHWDQPVGGEETGWKFVLRFQEGQDQILLAFDTSRHLVQLVGGGEPLGAQDSGHYYTVQVPRWGQLWRARGFWACICRADGSGHLRILKMQLMPNVVCHWNAWLKFRAERRGNRIQAWVDGVKGPCVTDDSYGPGRPGLTGFAKYIVRNLKIDGQPVDGQAPALLLHGLGGSAAAWAAAAQSIPTWPDGSCTRG